MKIISFTFFGREALLGGASREEDMLANVLQTYLTSFCLVVPLQRPIRLILEVARGGLSGGWGVVQLVDFQSKVGPFWGTFLGP